MLLVVFRVINYYSHLLSNNQQTLNGNDWDMLYAEMTKYTTFKPEDVKQWTTQHVREMRSNSNKRGRKQ